MQGAGRLPVDEARALIPAAPGDHEPFAVAIAHHGLQSLLSDGSSTGEVAIGNWPGAAHLLQVAGARLLIHGHGHERRVERLGWDGRPARSDGAPARGQLGREEFLRVMAPTAHLAAVRRPDGAAHGFNLISLERSVGKVERVVVQTYGLEQGTPREIDRKESEI